MRYFPGILPAVFTETKNKEGTPDNQNRNRFYFVIRDVLGYRWMR